MRSIQSPDEPVRAGDLLRRADPAQIATSRLAQFVASVAHDGGPVLEGYRELQAWSVAEPEDFWSAVWRHFDVRASQAPTSILSGSMPDARWFEGARLNYVDQVLRHRGLPGPAVVTITEDGTRRELAWPELCRQVGALAARLRDAGIGRGDRVVGYLPAGDRSVVAFLAAAAIGAVWSTTGPDYGASAAAARLAQLAPKALVASSSYVFNGVVRDRRKEVLALIDDLPGLEVVVHDADLGHVEGMRSILWDDAVAAVAEPAPVQVDSDHPLWVLYSSGTTGVPKGIVHGHAGVVTNHLATLGVNAGLGPGDVYFWYTTTNWMMWNFQVSGLLVGATVVLYEGSPTWPDAARLWDVAAAEQVRYLGVSPGYLQQTRAAGREPEDGRDLSSLRTVGVTGSPLSADLHGWTTARLPAAVQVVPTSGGTDVVGGFANGAVDLDVRAGQMGAASLGVDLHAFDDQGCSVRDEVGELVVRGPLPTMPLHFWNDPDGSRLREAYFDRFPGLWRHGDWVTVTKDGYVVVHGRSDSTLNRHGVRLGSADIYAVVEAFDEVAEALVIGAERADGGYWMPLFVTTNGADVDDDLRDRLRAAIRRQASPRHVPDDVVHVTTIPHTRTGKKLEVPVKRLLQGAAVADVVGPGTVDDSSALAWFEQYRTIRESRERAEHA